MLRSKVGIVGAGPNGLLAAIILSRMGHSTVLLDRLAQPSDHPQAHYLSSRTMEILRCLPSRHTELYPSVAHRIQSQLTPRSLWSNFVYCRALAGPLIASQNHFDDVMVSKLEKLSPCMPVHYPQNHLVRILLDELKESEENCQIMYGKSVKEVSVNQETVECSFSSSGKADQKLQCEVLIAADGASSASRKSLKIDLKGKFALQSMVNAHFFSAELAGALRNGPLGPAMLYFVYHPELVGVLVCHDLIRGEFVLQIPVFPPHETLSDFSMDRIKRILKSISPQVSSFDVRSIRSWIMNAAVAEKYGDHSGRVFLIGDACHQFPPAGGFGLNTGIGDVHNLAWKVAAALKAQPAPETWKNILKSYETERKPIAEANCDMSMVNFNKVLRVSQALGLDYNVAQTVHGVVSKVPLPFSLQKGLLEAAFGIGRRASQTIGRERLARSIVEQNQSIPLIFPDLDLNFSYDLNSETRSELPENLQIGRRFPHIEFGSKSSIDMCSPLTDPTFIRVTKSPQQNSTFEWNGLEFPCKSVRYQELGLQVLDKDLIIRPDGIIHDLL